MKKILAIALTLVMAMSMMTVAGATEQPAFGGGEGTESSPYQIGTVDHLKALATAVNGGNDYNGKVFKMTDSIDLSAESNWTPIGADGKSFKGTFDGDGKTIKNLNITGTGNSVGLFGKIESPATLKNIKLENASVTGQQYVGTIVGAAYTGTVSDCTVSGTITVTGNYAVGGLTGGGYAKLSNCDVLVSSGSVTGNYTDGSGLEGDNVGGLAGFRGEGNIVTENCDVQNLTVTGTRKVGGVLGYLHYGNTISGCTAKNVTVKSNATAEYISENSSTAAIGGIVGVVHNKTSAATISNCTAEDITLESANPCVAMGYVSGADRYGAQEEGATTTTATNVVAKGDCTGATDNAALGKDKDVVDRPTVKPSRPSGSRPSAPSGHLVTSTLDGIDKVYVDGAVVDSKYYTVSGGDVVLSEAFLNTLKAGEHTIKLVYGDRQATGTFTTKGGATIESAKTFDAGIAFYGMMALSSALGAAYVNKKK